MGSDWPSRRSSRGSSLNRAGTSGLLDLIYNEVVLREQAGESPALEEYLARFPDHTEALRAQFEVHQALRTAGSYSSALSTGQSDSLGADEAPSGGADEP